MHSFMINYLTTYNIIYFTRFKQFETFLDGMELHF